MFCKRQTARAMVKVLKNCMRFSKDGSNACSPLICRLNVMSRLQRSDVPSVLQLGWLRFPLIDSSVCWSVL